MEGEEEEEEEGFLSSLFFGETSGKTAPEKRENCPNSKKKVVSRIGGVIAGVICGLVVVVVSGRKKEEVTPSSPRSPVRKNHHSFAPIRHDTLLHEYLKADGDARFPSGFERRKKCFPIRCIFCI